MAAGDPRKHFTVVTDRFGDVLTVYVSDAGVVGVAVTGPRGKRLAFVELTADQSEALRAFIVGGAK